MNDWFEAENRVERAHELYEAGRWEEAESLLREALSLNPYHAEWHFNLGLTLDASGRFDEAVESFARAFELSTRDAQPAMMAGSGCIRAERYRDAILWFESAAEIDPRNVGSFVNRIHAYARLGEHEQAEVMFYLAQQAIVVLDGSAVLESHRGQGIYKNLLARRFADAQTAEMQIATIQALRTTSAPIVARLGFVECCSITLYG